MRARSLAEGRARARSFVRRARAGERALPARTCGVDRPHVPARVVLGALGHGHLARVGDFVAQPLRPAAGARAHVRAQPPWACHHAARHHAALGGLGHLVVRAALCSLTARAHGGLEARRERGRIHGRRRVARERPERVIGGAVHRRDVQDVCRAPCCKGGLLRSIPGGRHEPIGERARVRVGKCAHAHSGTRRGERPRGSAQRRTRIRCGRPIEAQHPVRVGHQEWTGHEPCDGGFGSRGGGRRVRCGCRAGAQPASASLRAQ